MIKDYILSDYYRYWGRIDYFCLVLIKALIVVNPGFTFSFWFRLSQGGGLFSFFAKIMYKHYCRKYCIYMPLSVKVGYGLYLGHSMCMVIAGGTKIGNNCNLSQFLNIGSSEGKLAVIEDNTWIGPHVSIVEDIRLGTNVSVGAGAVVVKDIPSNATAVGVPAQVISYEKPARYIINPWPYCKKL